MAVKIGMQTYGWYAYGQNFKTRFGLETVLHEAKSAGYDFIDLSGYTLAEIGKAAEAKKLFKKYGLKLVSMSCSIGDRKASM